MAWHTPVLTKEVVEFLNCESGKTYVDVTLGGGGWSEAILAASEPDGKLIGFDKDQDALDESGKRLNKFSNRFALVRSGFSSLTAELARLGINTVDGVVADLGVSSHQLEKGDRGFSFQSDARLDMRMDQDGELSAYELVNFSKAEDLERWFFEFGEERFTKRIVRSIIERRKENPIETTKELAGIVFKAVPKGKRYGRIHPATRIFQALRIVVNDELAELRNLVESAPNILNAGGRFVVASYHSLEDRIVKHSFVNLSKNGEFRLITKKPVMAGEEEISRNRRARSVRLRVLERI